MKKLFIFLSLFLLFGSVNLSAGELSSSIGHFGYSDDKKKAGLLDLTYSFSEKNVDTKYGLIKPVVGVFLSNRLSSMAYAGVKADYKISIFRISPSFTPGLYSSGEGKRGKDLGSVMQFKSQVDIGIDLNKFSFFNLGYSHISNAGIGTNNPGANTYSFNFSKKF